MMTSKRVTFNNAELAALYGLKKGDSINVTCCDGVPIDREWRNRFKDAERDHCITIHSSNPKTKKGGKTDANSST